VCAERIHRLMMAFMVGVSMFLFLNGTLMLIASTLQAFIILMIIIWAIFDFCPSLWMLKKVLKPCKNYVCLNN